jgi:hypothetical protein
MRTCRFCPFTTRYPSAMRQHERVHTGEKPFACQYCPFRSAQKCHVQRHELRHSSQDRAAAKAASATKSGSADEPTLRYTVEYNPAKPELDDRALKRLRPEEKDAEKKVVTDSAAPQRAHPPKFTVKKPVNGTRNGKDDVSSFLQPPRQSTPLPSSDNSISATPEAASNQFFSSSGPVVHPLWGPPPSSVHPSLQAAMFYYAMARGYAFEVSPLQDWVCSRCGSR